MRSPSAGKGMNNRPVKRWKKLVFRHFQTLLIFLCKILVWLLEVYIGRFRFFYFRSVEWVKLMVQNACISVAGVRVRGKCLFNFNGKTMKFNLFYNVRALPRTFLDKYSLASVGQFRRKLAVPLALPCGLQTDDTDYTFSWKLPSEVWN